MDRLHVEITNPFIVQVIRGLVDSGEFVSAEDVVTSGVLRLTEVQLESLTEEDRAAIADAEADFARGDYVEFREVKEEILKRIGRRGQA